MVHSIASLYNCQKPFFTHIYLQNFAFFTQHIKYYISVHKDILKCFMIQGWIGLNVWLQPKKISALEADYEVEKAPGLQSIWDWPLFQIMHMLRIGLWFESVSQFLCYNNIRTSHSFAGTLLNVYSVSIEFHLHLSRTIQWCALSHKFYPRMEGCIYYRTVLNDALWKWKTAKELHDTVLKINLM